MKYAKAWVAILAVGLFACGSDDTDASGSGGSSGAGGSGAAAGSTATGGSSAMGGSAGAATGGTGGAATGGSGGASTGGLEVPASTELASSFGSPSKSALICQTSGTNGVSFGLFSGMCTNRIPYLKFVRGMPTVSGEDYLVSAGRVVATDGSETPTEITSTTVGVVGELAGQDAVGDLPGGTEITIETQGHTVTFSFEDDTLTVTEFTAK